MINNNKNKHYKSYIDYLSRTIEVNKNCKYELAT